MGYMNIVSYSDCAEIDALEEAWERLLFIFGAFPLRSDGESCVMERSFLNKLASIRNIAEYHRARHWWWAWFET